MASVFITRELQAGSEFLRILKGAGYEVEGESLVEFSAISFEHIPDCDWVFFYSSRGVQFFFEQIKKLNLTVPSTKFAVMGKGTAETLRKYTKSINFIGVGEPKSTALAFKNRAAGQVVLFPRAKNSKQSIQKLLLGKIISIDLIVYENKPKDYCHMRGRDFLVFTSPLNVEAYFNKNVKLPHQKIVAIGETTAAALRRLGYNEAATARYASERSMANSVIQLSS